MLLQHGDEAAALGAGLEHRGSAAVAPRFKVHDDADALARRIDLEEGR